MDFSSTDVEEFLPLAPSTSPQSLPKPMMSTLTSTPMTPIGRHGRRMSIDGAHYYPRNNRARVTFWSCEASAKTFMENLEWFRDHKEFCRHAPQLANQIPQQENPIPPIQEPSRYISKLFFFCVIVLCLFFLSKFYYDNYINVRPKCFWDYFFC